MSENAAPSAAAQLLQQHLAHRATVEDAEDVDLPKPASAVEAATTTSTTPSSAGTKKTNAQGPPPTQSLELFPELGGAAPKPTANVAPVWAARSNGSAHNGVASEDSASRSSGGTPTVAIPGRNVEYMLLEPHHVLPRTKLKRPLPDIVKDFNRKSRAQVKVSTQPDGKVRVEATGHRDVATQALKDFVAIIGTKQSIKVEIPRSARAHIIGKGGATIKALQEKTGARIQMPRVEESQQGPADEDDDEPIDVVIEGNAQQAAAARNAVLQIVGERASNVSARVKGVPAVFFPFIANSPEVRSIEGDKGVQIRVPPFHPCSCQPPAAPAAPGMRPEWAASEELHIQLAGEREAVHAAREAILQRVEELRARMMMEQLSIQRGRHQFIIGERGIPMDAFFQETGCAVIMPSDDDDDIITIVGHPDQLQAGVDRAMDLAMNMQCSNIDISRFHRQAPGGAAAHARNVTRYLRARKEISRLEKTYGVHFNTPYSDEGALPWELFSRDGKSAIRAQSEIKGLVESHPPARMTTVAVDAFYHPYFQNELLPRVRQNYGVQLVIPTASEASAPVLLVYEGSSDPDSYQIPRGQPTQADLNEMQKHLQDARAHILDFMKQQEPVSSLTMEAEKKYHDKLRRFIKGENEKRVSAGHIPIRVSSAGSRITLRGPSSAVEALNAKCNLFLADEKRDEKERDFTLEFDFPQKFANHLIGKGGSRIQELREQFDVDIQVDNGKVLLKGPKAKAEAAKTHITAFGRQLADEATYTLKIEPKYHRELIGPQGSQINRLQTRYNVKIFFPRVAKSTKDDVSVVSSSSDSGTGRSRRAQRPPDEVTVRGPKRGADEARDEILSLLQYLKDHSFTETVTVQQKQVPSLIGSGGAALEQLRQSTGAKIDIPSAKDTADALVEISIKGTKAQVAAAKKVLEEKKAVFDDTVVKTIDVDRKFHKSLIGPGGSNLRDIVLKAGGSDDRRELARAVQFPKQDSDGNTIKVEGRTEVVDKIIAQIETIVSELEGQVTEVLDVPVSRHRSLIGRGGEAKRKLEAQFKVSLDIPRQGSDQTGVKIVGQPADVEKAKEHIQTLVKEQEGETVQVPRSLHHTITNNGQIFRSFKNDFGVTVDHAGHELPPKPAGLANVREPNAALPLITDDADSAADAHSWKVVENHPASNGAGADATIPWVLRGPAGGIEKAKKAVAAALEQAARQTHTGLLVLPDPRTYRFVIGQGGSKVNAIRKESGCRVNVPRGHGHGGSGDEAIEIVGSKEGVERAKELILAAVKEGVAGGSGGGRRPPRE
ncbi:hypothetical protein VTK26DRAFT_8796 [Humicola hyalothermophila]